MVGSAVPELAVGHDLRETGKSGGIEPIVESVRDMQDAIRCWWVRQLCCQVRVAAQG